MSDQLHVWTYLQREGRHVLCGTLRLLQGRRCLFSYADAWLNRAGAFALSPDLPLRPGVHEPAEGFDIHPIFEDAGPDRWGRNVINKVFNPQRRSPLEYLQLAGENRIGALGFSQSATEYAVEGVSFGVADIPDLVRAADALAMRLPLDEAMRRLLRPGSSAGGARPKAVIRHKDADWIVKFPADGDDCDVCALEHASLVLAGQCGIRVAESELLKMNGMGSRHALLVKRFDRDGRERLHFASARTLLIAAGVKEGAMGYADLAEVARQLSASPVEDSHELFRRMVFNVLIENTDDHEKNHAFIFRDRAWRLSPAYDVLPQLQGLGFHQLRIGQDGNEAKLANLLSEPERFLLKRVDAEVIVADVQERVAGWRQAFLQSGVSSRDIALCEGFVLRASVFAPGPAKMPFEAELSAPSN